MSSTKVRPEWRRLQTERRVRRLRALHILQTEESQNTPQEEDIFALCKAGNLDRLAQLLKEKHVIDSVLLVRLRPTGEAFRPKQNLALMLLEAAAGGQPRMIRYLIEFGQKHEVSMETLINPDAVLAAIKSTNLEALEVLLDTNPEAANFDIGLGISILETTIAAGGRLGAPPGLGGRIMPPYRNAYMPAIELLLQKGADPNRMIPCRSGIVGSVATFGSIDLMQLMIRYGARITNNRAIHCAAEAGRVDMLRFILEQGADLNEQYDESCFYTKKLLQTPLHRAVQFQKLNTVVWLLAHGVDVSLKNADGQTALDLAASLGSVNLLKAFDGGFDEISASDHVLGDVSIFMQFN